MEDRYRSIALSPVSRRVFLRAAGGVLLAGPLATLLAACGGPTQPAPPSQPAATAPPPAAPAAGASPAPAAAKIKPGGTLKVAIGADISSMDPHLTTDNSTAGARAHVFDFLVWAYRPDAKIMPMLATKWEAASDAKSYTFTLTDKPVKFHDGSPFTAEAVKATYERLVEPSRSSAAKNELDMIAKVDVIDPKTVKFNLTRAYAPFARAMCGSPAPVISAEAIKKYGEDFAQHPIGTGPYKFVEYVKGDHLTLEKTPDYWGQPGNFDTIIYKIVPEAGARVVQLETGESQVVDRVPPTDAERLEKNDQVSILRTLTTRSVWYYLNENRPLMKDVRVRRAVNYAVDRKSIMDNILKGFGALSDSPLSKTMEFYAPQTPYPYTYDPEKAKSLLKEAGVAEGTKLVMWTPVGRYVGDKEWSTAVQDMLKKVGFDVTLQAIGDWPTYLQSLNTLDWDMAVWGWAPTNNADQLQLGVNSKYAKIFMNWSSYSNPTVDDLLTKASADPDEKKRADYYAQAQKIIVDEAAFLLMHYQAVATGISKKVTGVYLTPDEAMVLREAGYVG